MQVEILLRRFSRDWRLLGNFVKENSKLNFVKMSTMQTKGRDLYIRNSHFLLLPQNAQNLRNGWCLKEGLQTKLQEIQMLVPNPLRSFLKNYQEDGNVFCNFFTLARHVSWLTEVFKTNTFAFSEEGHIRS